MNPSLCPSSSSMPNSGSVVDEQSARLSAVSAIQPPSSLLQLKDSQSQITLVPEAPSALLLSAIKVFVRRGESFPIKLMTVRSDGTTEDVSDQAEWTVNDPAIADVVKDSTGISILGKSTGTEIPDDGSPKYGRTTVTVTYGEHQPITLFVTVAQKVSEPDIGSVFLQDTNFFRYYDGAQLRLYKGQAPYALNVVAQDLAGEIFNITDGTWSYDRSDIVHANADGNVEALNAGKTNAVYTFMHYGVEYRLHVDFTVVDLQAIEAETEHTGTSYTVELHPNESTAVAINEVYLDENNESHTVPVAASVHWQVDDPQLISIGDEFHSSDSMRGQRKGRRD